MKVEDNSKQKQLLLKSLPIANVPFYLLIAHAALARDQMQLHLPRSPIGLYHQAQFLQKDWVWLIYTLGWRFSMEKRAEQKKHSFL